MKSLSEDAIITVKEAKNIEKTIANTVIPTLKNEAQYSFFMCIGKM